MEQVSLRIVVNETALEQFCRGSPVCPAIRFTNTFYECASNAEKYKLQRSVSLMKTGHLKMGLEPSPETSGISNMRIIQTGSGAHSSFYLIRTRGSFPGGEVAGT
jgi:hypothetical protein